MSKKINKIKKETYKDSLKNRKRKTKINVYIKTFKEWIPILDALCKEVIILRDDGKCRRCGQAMYISEKSGKLIGCDWSHIFRRNNYRVRWDLDNSKLLCSSFCGKHCHAWWHRNEVDGVLWWQEQIGKRKMELLKLRKEGDGSKIDCNAIHLYLLSEKKRLQTEKEKENHLVGDLS